MNQSISVIENIIEFLFGRKYYANIIATRGTTRRELSSYIFLSRKDAESHQRQIAATSSFQWIETISFRSKTDYSN